MPDLTTKQARQATRLKMAVDLARADYDRAQGPGWSERELQAALAHYRLCDKTYRAFMAQGPHQDEPALSGKLPSAEKRPTRLDSGNGSRPSGHRIGAETSKGGSADQMTLDVEGVVDRCVGGEESLG